MDKNRAEKLVSSFLYRKLKQKQISSLLKIYNSIQTQDNMYSFMKDKRIKKLVHNIYKNHNQNKKFIHLFLTALLIYKYPKNHLQGIIGIEIYSLIHHIFQRIQFFTQFPNQWNLNVVFHDTTLLYHSVDIWLEQDKQLHIEQIAHFIFEQKRQRQLTKDEKIIDYIDEMIEKRYQEAKILSNHDSKVIDYIDSYEPRLFNKHLENDVKKNFHQAFRDILLNDMNNKDFRIVYDTLKQFIERIQYLTPNNEKQKEYIGRVFDLDLLQQILENDAFDKDLFMNYIQKFKSIFEEYHASVDLQDSRKLFDDFIHDNAGNENIVDTLINFFQLLDKEISIIEKRIHDFYNDENSKQE